MSSFFLGSGVIAGIMILLWLISVRLRDVSIIDTFWGLGFVVLSWVYLLTTPAPGPRAWLVVALVTVWGLRLGLHIGLRGRGHGEDYRYAAMRERRGESFWWVSLFQVFGLQAVLMLGISLPLLLAILSSGPLGWVDILGSGIFLLGLSFEALGDLQLKRFKADPANRGQTLRTGLWRYTRHPNYFGDALLWWGLFVIGGVATGAFWTIIAPAIMTLLLMRVSGVPLLEARLARTRPDFADYASRTNTFFPWFPRRTPLGASLSLLLLPALLLTACAGPQRPPLEALDTPIDLEGFMGDWYVLGAIPIDNFLASETGAHNALESYRLDEKGRIQTTYTFRDGAFDGPLKRFTPVGFVHDTRTRAEWRMRFLWPFKSAYLIFHLEAEAGFTLIGVPDRSNVWIMGRSPEVSDEDYARLVALAASAGYSADEIRRIPHAWAEGELAERSTP